MSSASAAIPQPGRTKAFLRLVMIEHSVFALPFAYIAALTAMWRQTGSIHWVQLLLITIAMVSARTVAMSANRILDRRYDALNPRESSGDFAFYLPMIMAAESVLDVGCGTGSLLHLARESGHRGRLVGLDPAEGMLAQARRRDDVEWVLGDLSTVAWDGEFDFAVMTGHAFQVLLTDDELRTAFAAIRRALKPGGRFGFDTRDPAARAWERWTPAHVSEVVTADGTAVRS